MSEPTITLDGRFLLPEDLRDKDGAWREYTLTVKRVIDAGELMDGAGKPIDCQSLEFLETTKFFTLTSKTNKRLLKAQFPAALVGAKVTLYPVVGNWFGQSSMLGIRVRIPKGLPCPHVKAKDVGKDLTR